jgi:outer membrane lipoprotein-sorting protein
MEGAIVFKIRSAFCLILFLGIAAPALFAQQFTTQEVLAQLDKKAAAFKVLETDVSHSQTVEGHKHPSKAGKIYVKTAKDGPRFFWDVTEPKERMKILIDKGELKTYFPNTNSYYPSKKVDPKGEMLQLLLLGFGVPSATITKNYSAAVTGQEAVGSVQAVVLDLTSISSLTAKYPKITLWLNPQTWTPVRTRVTEKSRDYADFNYSNIRLNGSFSDSVFNLKIPGDAKRQ